MPSFGRTSQTRLDTCHADWQQIMSVVIKYIDCSIFCGYRDEAGQDKAVKDGKSQTKWPDSKHNTSPSMAIDAGPYFSELKNTDWKDSKAFAAFAGYVQRVAHELLEKELITHDVRWGGDWDGDGRTLDQTFNDLVHFELIKPNKF